MSSGVGNSSLPGVIEAGMGLWRRVLRPDPSSDPPAAGTQCPFLRFVAGVRALFALLGGISVLGRGVWSMTMPAAG